MEIDELQEEENILIRESCEEFMKIKPEEIMLMTCRMKGKSMK